MGSASPEFDALLAMTKLDREKADGIKSLIAASKLAADYQARAEVAEAALERIGKVLFDHSHADTCATELSPDAGYECSCWRSGIWAALEAKR